MELLQIGHRCLDLMPLVHELHLLRSEQRTFLDGALQLRRRMLSATTLWILPLLISAILPV